ncbi:MAG: CocE/NonD family hydrolase [Candidatus Aminicenantales bacterium]
MSKTSNRFSRTAAVAFAVFLAAGLGAGLEAQSQEKISRFGEYKGYSAPVYDSWVRTSRYLTMRDGVRLAADIIRLALKGKVEEKPLPAIFIHTRYRRAAVSRQGKVQSEADQPLGQLLLKHGYAVVSVDVRGSGASFGVWQGLFSPDETRGAYEIIEWVAAQPWCDGKIGMSGASYLGTTQLMAATTRPPHLKALLPAVPLFDVYAVGNHNGVFFEDLVKTWSDLTMMLDTTVPAAPVDADRDGSTLKQALKEHAGNRPTIEIFEPLRFRDSRDLVTGALPMLDWHPAGHVREITDAKIPMYLWGGWFDSFTRDAFLMWKNFDVPRKLTVGAWSHSPRDPEIQKEEYYPAFIEELRWFDYWLKGIDNGIMSEPAIRYQVMKSPKVREWRTAATWPVPEATGVDYYLQAGPSGSVQSVNDGGLKPEQPAGQNARDAYAADYTTTTGTTTRWDNAVGGGFGYPDMKDNDTKGLTYTTAPLAKDVEVTGHPVVRLWVSSTTDDAELFAYLEEVDPAGVAHYVTEGTIKASYRALGEAPYDYLGLPFHRSYKEDVVPLKPGEPVELVFDMEPTSNVFDAGNRIRLTITCADKDNAEVKDVSPAPKVTLYRDKGRASRITLPVVGGMAGGESATADQKAKAGSLMTYVLFIVFLVLVLVIAFTYYMRRRTRL